VFESLHSSQVRGAVEPKICENCRDNFYRESGSKTKLCKKCRVPFATPEKHEEFFLELHSNSKRPYTIH
jgi:uncharacterized CHY-type Zn-finger protein